MLRFNRGDYAREIPRSAEKRFARYDAAIVGFASGEGQDSKFPHRRRTSVRNDNGY